MKLLRLCLVVVHLCFLTVVAAHAQEPIKFARTPDISPDGKQVAFSYLGDIWVVDSIGGTARQVTRHIAHDISPVFSPDGKKIAFSSNRHGSYNVFVIPAQGGKATRLTFDSASDLVTGWSPDGKHILFASLRDTAFPPGFALYSVPSTGGRVKRISKGEGREGVYSPDGRHIAYVRGPGTWYRKGYRGSANDDIWICDADGSNNRRLTTFDGQDNSPMWSADGETIYYVSEVLGNPANIVKTDAKGTQKPRLVTMHKEDSVRRARISTSGEWIVYECGPDLWITSTREGISARKLAIEVHADDAVNPETTRTFTQGASEFALSPDEQHVAFVVHGDIFLMSVPGPGAPREADPARPKATRLTNSPSFDHGMAWSPDGKKMIFASDRNGHENLYLLESDDKEHPKLAEAQKFKVHQLTDTNDAEFGASFSPDGKRVAYIRAGRLWTMKPDGTEQKILVDQPQVFDYEWSPDSRWIAYARMDGSFASEIYILPVGGGESRNVTRHATYNGGITWSSTGNKLAFVGERRRQAGMCVLSLQKPAIKGTPPSNEIDWEDIHLRVTQPAPMMTAEEGAISPDGSKIAFRAGSTGGHDLWVVSTDGKQLSRLTTGGVRPRQIQWSRKYPGWIFFHDRRGMFRMVKHSSGSDFASLFSTGLGGPAGSSSRFGAGGEGTVIPFEVKMTIRRDEQFQEMFEQSWRALNEHFYDPKFHGVDWLGVRNRYRPLVKHVAMKEDLYVLISLMMGELNASHMGISGTTTVPEHLTADLGLIFDEQHDGPGLKIAEILKRGPADKRGLKLHPGDIIVAIDDVELRENTNISKLLNDKVEKIVTLRVVPKDADPNDLKARRKVEIQATSREKVKALMYDRWVEQNARRVAELSNGKLGYIHIPSMDDVGLDRFVRALYSDNFDKEGIVLDVRFNGGGFTHDQVLNYLGGREHTVFRQRHGGEGAVLRSFDRKWTKPLVLLINNRSYSDAEIFPSAFRTLGYGKLVGQATGGHVIGTTSIQLIDGSRFRIPRTGVYTLGGVNMEKQGVAPDIAVETHPDQLDKGIDAQLDKAVEILQKDVDAWKKSQPSLAGTPSRSKPAPPKTSASPVSPKAP